MINENPIGSNTSNLKSFSTARILSDMIGEVKKQAQDAFLIIIVDDYTALILSSFLTVSEVLNQGIFSIERLGTKRQKFPKYHGLYFISPTAESCQLLAKDFEDDSLPQYSRVHVYFSHRIMDVTLEKMVTQNLVRRVLTCKELNLSFLIKDKNLFDLGLPGALKLFTVKNNNDSKSRILSSVMEKLVTVCNVLKEFPYIQYQKNSPFCLNLAEKVNAELSEFYETKFYNEKRGVLLILDRTIDVTTPFLHDYTYESLVYDLFKTKDNELEFKEKKYKLDEKDELWMKYKNKHIADVIETLQNDFQLFMESDLSKVRDSDKMEELDDMSKALQNMKGYKTKSAQFGLHLGLVEEINNVFSKFIS
jgi:syntaxin-binding protein 1